MRWIAEHCSRRPTYLRLVASGRRVVDVTLPAGAEHADAAGQRALADSAAANHFYSRAAECNIAS